MSKVKVGFICVHNSCRSQMAEALGKKLANEEYVSYNAGTHTKNQINQDTVRLMKMQYEIDMELTQYPKILDEIPELDIVITMGCNVDCPCLPCKHREDWGLDAPSGKEDAEFIKTMGIIEFKVKELAQRIQDNEFKFK